MLTRLHQASVWGIILVFMVFFSVLPSYSAPPPDPVHSLIKDLFSRDTQVRIRACQILGDMGPVAEKARGPLQMSLDYDRVSFVRFKAAEALGKIGDPKAVPALVDALWDRQGNVGRGIATALGFLKDKKGKGEKALLGILTNHLSGEGQRFISNFDGIERSLAALSLGRLRSTQAVPFLIVTLKDPDWRVRLNSALGLGLIKDPSAISAVQEATNDPNGLVVQAAQWALQRITSDPSEQLWPDQEQFYKLLRENGVFILSHD